MADQVLFTPHFEVINTFPGAFETRDFDGEPSMYACSPAFVQRHGGDLARLALANIPETYLEAADSAGMEPNVDVRVHRLAAGDFPATPGWHCDGALRELYFGQQSGERVPVLNSLVCTISDRTEGVSNTQFLTVPYTATIESEDKQEFELWQQVDEQLGNPDPAILQDGEDGQMIQFDTQTLHRAMAAKRSGTRLFMRVSLWGLGDGSMRGTIAKAEQIYRPVDLSDPRAWAAPFGE